MVPPTLNNGFWHGAFGQAAGGVTVITVLHAAVPLVAVTTSGVPAGIPVKDDSSKRRSVHVFVHEKKAASSPLS